MSRLASAIIITAALSGCASITSDSTQAIRVDALDEQGVAVANAECQLSNDKGVYDIDAGRHAMVRKSGEDMAIRCSSPDRNDAAEGTAISRVGAGMFGNILFGGGVGAIIDHNRGTAYNYPEWVQVVFGQIMIFDRTNHNDGQPTAGAEAVTTAVATQR